jgi:hypothetical protein
MYCHLKGNFASRILVYYMKKKRIKKVFIFQNKSYQKYQIKRFKTTLVILKIHKKSYKKQIKKK